MSNNTLRSRMDNFGPLITMTRMMMRMMILLPSYPERRVVRRSPKTSSSPIEVGKPPIPKKAKRKVSSSYADLGSVPDILSIVATTEVVVVSLPSMIVGVSPESLLEGGGSRARGSLLSINGTISLPPELRGMTEVTQSDVEAKVSAVQSDIVRESEGLVFKYRGHELRVLEERPRRPSSLEEAEKEIYPPS
ncbi:hypothetical protein ACFE04_004890 [Oxalis oulophora]